MSREPIFRFIDGELERLQRARALLSDSLEFRALPDVAEDRVTAAPLAETVVEDAAEIEAVPVQVIKSRGRRERVARPRRREPEPRALGNSIPNGWVAVSPVAAPKVHVAPAPVAASAKGASDGSLESMIRELQERKVATALG